MNAELRVLLGEIEKTRALLERLFSIFRDQEEAMAADRPSLEKAVLLSELFANSYTCMETLLFRISQAFENSLSKERWHAELLEKMTLRIPGIREAVLSDDTYALLDEFRKFRHFKRYYFSMDYDWDKLRFLGKKFLALVPACRRDLAAFVAFLERLDASTD